MPPADSGVLSESAFQELQRLYAFRNRVIHRFIISGITYDEVGPRLDAYETVWKQLYQQLKLVERPAPPLSDAEAAGARARIARKLGARAGDVPPPAAS